MGTEFGTAASFDQSSSETNMNGGLPEHIGIADESEELECRVCRGGAEEGRPLFAPCKCSGSIGLVHQDCLMSWLAMSRGDGRCELCSYQFQFAPKYADGAPEKLPPFEVMTGIMRRAAIRWIPFAFRIAIALSLWLLVLPLSTAYLYHAWMHRPSFVAKRWKWDLLAGDTVTGAVVAAAIILSFLSLMNFADFLRFHWQDNEGQQDRNPAPRGQPPAEPRRLPDDYDPTADVDEIQTPVAVQSFAPKKFPSGEVEDFSRSTNPRNALGVMDQRELYLPNMQHQELQMQRQQNAAATPESNATQTTATLRHLSSDIDSEHQYDDFDSSSYNNLDDRKPKAGTTVRRQRQRLMLQRQVFEDRAGDNDDEDEDDGHSTKIRKTEAPIDRSGKPGPDNSAVENPFIAPDEDPDRNFDAPDRLPNLVEPPLAPEQPEVVVPRNDVGEVALEPLQEGRFEPRFQPAEPPPDQNQDDGMDVEINLALDELLGIRGPFPALIRNLGWLLLFNSFYLGLFAFIPQTIGSSILSVLINSTISDEGDAAAPNVSRTDAEEVGTNETLAGLTGLIEGLNSESRRLDTIFVLPDLATTVMGYMVLTLLVFFSQWLISLCKKILAERNNERNTQGDNEEAEGQEPANLQDIFDDILRDVDDGNDEDDINGWRPGWRNDDDDDNLEGQRGDARNMVWGWLFEKLEFGLDCAAAVAKVGLLLFIKMFLLPLVLGIWLDACTLPLFDKSAHDRIVYAGADLFGSLLLHWVVGITFMLLVTVGVLQLREVVHPDLLAQAIRPQEPQPDLLGNLLQEGAETHAKRVVLSLGIYSVLLLIHVWVPARIFALLGLGQYLPPFRPRFCHFVLPQLQVPVELIIFHLSMLAFLEKYKNHIGDMEHFWLVKVCNFMGLVDYMLPTGVEKFALVGSKPVFRETIQNVRVDGRGNDACSRQDSGAQLGNGVLNTGNDAKDQMQLMVDGCPVTVELDPFWTDLLDEIDQRHDIEDFIQANICNAPKSVFSTGKTTKEGRRVLESSRSLIRLPKLGAAFPLNEKPEDSKDVSSDDAKGKNSKREILIPTTVGKYRLQKNVRKRGQQVTGTLDFSTCLENYVEIEFWREVPGVPIQRPPEGWDDLGAGGAEVQGRWSWGNERKSQIEEGVAGRKSFFPTVPRGGLTLTSRLRRWRNFVPLVLKLLSMFVLSWMAILVVSCSALSAPLMLGRFIFFLMRLPVHYQHDPFGFALGSGILFPVGYNLASFLLRKRNREMSATSGLFRALRRWFSTFHAPPKKSGKLRIFLSSLVLWTIAAPFLVGACYDLFVVKPSSWWSGNDPLVDTSSLFTSWLFGLCLLHLWASLCYVGAFRRQYWIENEIVENNDAGEINNDHDRQAGARNEGQRNGEARNQAHTVEMQHLDDDVDGQQTGVWQGNDGRVQQFSEVIFSVLARWEWDKVEHVPLLEEFAVPIVRQLSLSLMVPLLVSFAVTSSVNIFLANSYHESNEPFFFGGSFRLLVYRLVAVITMSLQIAGGFQKPLQRWFDAVHKAARDDRYLIGEILLNYKATRKTESVFGRKAA